jgi:hypothetical protein
MKRRFGLTLVLALLSTSGCEKNPFSGVEERGGSTPSASAAFAKEYEEWKTRAVNEFPELGKAGTPMNSRFVARAKQLSEQKADELKYPNWPYLLAVKIEAELSASSRGEASKGKSGVVLEGIGKVYTVQDLKGINALSGAALVVGRVTKFDEIGLPPGVLMMVLDDALKCEVTMCDVIPGESLSWQRSGSSISLIRQLGRGGSATVSSVSMGQVLRVEGVFTQRRGAPVLVGSAKYHW